MTDVNEIRARAHGPALYAHGVAEGNLRHIGMAEWALPEDPGTPGEAHTTAYMHSLKTLNGAEYEAFVAPGVATLGAQVMSRADMEALRADLIGNVAARIANSELQAGGVYRRGTSIALQSCMLSPNGTTPPFTAHDYAPILTSIRALFNGTMWAQIGEGNHSLSFPGSFKFNNRYPIRARPLENTFRKVGSVEAVVAGDAIGLDQDAWVYDANSFPNAALTQAKFYPHTVYDPTDPTVFALIQSSVAALVTALGTQVRWMVEGEGSLSHRGALGRDTSRCGLDPIEATCWNCDPTTHYSQRMLDGFRVWLQQVKGETIATVNDRWGKAYTSFSDVDPRVAYVDQGFVRYEFARIPQAQADYEEYLSYLRQEVAIQNAITAKATNNAAIVSKFGFGLKGGEDAWLGSDLATRGDWHNGDSQEIYRVNRRNWFDRIIAGDRLSGTRGGLAITCSTFGPASALPQAGIPPLLKALRTYTRDMVNWSLRDAWCSGVFHFGYLHTIGFAINGDPPSVDAVLGAFEALTAIRATHLEGFGPWQRYAIHSSNLEGAFTEKDTGSGRQAYALYDRLRVNNIPCALFQNQRVMTRTLAQWHLKRSLVVVPFHDDQAALLPTYLTWFPAGAPGAALFICDGSPTGTVASLGAPVMVDETGALHRVHQAGTNTNVWVYLCRDRRVCTTRDTYYQRIADLVEGGIRATIEAAVASTTADPFVVAPLLFSGSEVVAQYNTDGLNWSVAVSNMTTTAGSVTITVDPRLATALGVTYAPAVVALAGNETKFVLIEATSTGINVAAAITDAQGALASLAGYDVAAVTDLLTKAAAIVGTRPGRALALYAQACRLPVLRATYGSGNVTINARRLGVTTEANVVAVTGARVQLTFPLNYGEEQAAEAVTNGSGDAVVAVGSPVTKRWDFITTNAPVTPAGSARAYVEAHVTDLGTGATAKIGFTT